MPNLIEDRLSSLPADWIDTNRPGGFPESIPVHVARRDEIRTRPCIVLNTSESKPVPALPHTARMKLDVHLFSQVDDTRPKPMPSGPENWWPRRPKKCFTLRRRKLAFAHGKKAN